MLHSSTGRRPTRSDSRPHSGMNRNCIAENAEATRGGDEVAGPEIPGHPRQERDDQTEPQQVQEHRQKQGSERGFAHRSVIYRTKVQGPVPSNSAAG